MSSNLSFFIFALIIMATKRIIPDPDFGYIILRSRRLARNITMRVKPDGLYVTVPPYSKTDRVMAVLSSYRERLLEDFRKVAVKKIDFNFSIQSECFRLSLVPSDMKCFMLRQTEEGINICCPRDTDFSKEEVQKLVRNAIIRALKKQLLLICLLFFGFGPSAMDCPIKSTHNWCPNPLGKLHSYAYY